MRYRPFTAKLTQISIVAAAGNLIGSQEARVIKMATSGLQESMPVRYTQNPEVQEAVRAAGQQDLGVNLFWTYIPAVTPVQKLNYCSL